MRTLIPGVPPPIIMISGKASTKDVIKGLQAGSCDYITKPFQPQEVLARVETQLRLYMGEVQQLQETAERNMALLTQVCVCMLWLLWWQWCLLRMSSASEKGE